MTKRVKRNTIYRSDHPFLADKQAVLERLKGRDLISVRAGGAIWVAVGVLAEPLDTEEREVLYKLLGYTWDKRQPLVAKRAGTVGGRAAIAGRRIPVWQIESLARQGMKPSGLMAEFGLSAEEVAQALAYARRRKEEIEQDILDQEHVRLLVASMAGQ